jgi:PAS domain-containing protein
MKRSISVFILFALLIHSQRVLSQALDPQEMQVKEMIHAQVRSFQWGNYREDEEFRDFLVTRLEVHNSGPRRRLLSQALIAGDYETFISHWNEISPRVRAYFVTDFDIVSGRTPFHILAEANPQTEDDFRILDTLCEVYSSLMPSMLYIPVPAAGYVYTGINTSDFGSGTTPMHSAASFNNLALAQRLVRCGSFIDHRNEITGSTPLMIAAMNGGLEMFHFLIDNGADQWAVDSMGDGVYYYANNGRIRGRNSEPGEIFAYLDDQGHDFATQAVRECTTYSANGRMRTQENDFIFLNQPPPQSINADFSQSDFERREQTLEELEKELTALCEFVGYQHCYPVYNENSRPRPEAEIEFLEVDGSRGALVYRAMSYEVWVVGNRSGNANACEDSSSF